MIISFSLHNSCSNKMCQVILTKPVSRIWISHFCTIEVELINGVRIKNITEKDNLKAKLSNASFDLCGQSPQFAAQTVQNIEEVNNEHSIECNDNSCQSADGNKP
jgi:hypothetical protein